MNEVKRIQKRRVRRKARCRKSAFGTPDRPRMTVFRSLKNIYVQLVDDVSGRTLVHASSRDKELQAKLNAGGNKSAAVEVGKLVGQRATAQGITTATFDRNGYRFHGRIKALADAARESGLTI